MLVIDVAGILSFIFWTVIVIAVLGFLGFIFSAISEGLGETLKEWKKEGTAYVIFMVVGCIAIAAIYLFLLLNQEAIRGWGK